MTDASSLQHLARELNEDPEHAFQVCRLALRLLDLTGKLHGLGGRPRALLEAAALLHDIGLRYGAPAHHKRSCQLILEMKLPGFTEEERAIIACVARYHRKAHPDPGHVIYGDLGPDARGIVRVLASILRIADGLDRSHLSAAQQLEAEVHSDRVVISVVQDPPNETDLFGARRKRQLFEEVFSRSVEIVRHAPD